MDGVSALVDGPRAQRAFALKAVFDGTWSITVEDRAPLTLVVMARGRATFTGNHGATDVGTGDVVMVRGPAPYTFADSAQTPEDIRILRDQVCVDPHGRILAEDMELDVRTRGNTRSEDATVMLIGTYQQETSVGAMLLSKLPVELVIRDLEPALIGLFAQEIVGDGPGQVAVIDRLLDVLVLRCVRTVLTTSSDPQGTTWSDARSAPSRNSPNTRGPSSRWQPVSGCRVLPSRDASPRRWVNRRSRT